MASRTLFWVGVEVVFRELFRIHVFFFFQISDHPLATNGSVHKLLIKADMMGIKKEREVEIGVVRNASKLDRQTKTRWNEASFVKIFSLKKQGLP